MTWWGGSSKSVILYASGLDVFPLDEYFTGQTSLGLPRRWQPQDKAGRGVENVNIAHQHSFKLPWQLFTEPWSVTEWVTAILEKDKKTKKILFLLIVLLLRVLSVYGNHLNVNRIWGCTWKTCTGLCATFIWCPLILRLFQQARIVVRVLW